VGKSAPVDVSLTLLRQSCLRTTVKPLQRKNWLYALIWINSQDRIVAKLKFSCTELPVYFLALAADHDGTIANHGFVDESTAGTLRQLKETGRRLVLVTGRELADLRHAFAEITIFDRFNKGAVMMLPPGVE
jgi:hypothetical protein